MKLKVNGEIVTYNGPMERPLLWVLREEMGLTAAKYGCGVGACGACTVHLDDTAIRSCITPISDVEGRKVLTLEGLSAGVPHPVQIAWEEGQVPQCGYCQPGQMMSAAALLSKKSDPSKVEIENEMSGNLCRCGTYSRIRKAIIRASEITKQASESSDLITENGEDRSS